jgi:hypothetical protein
MRTLIIWPGISRRIGACQLTHEGLVRFLNGLRSDLENHYQIYRVLRDEEEPRFFHYLVAFADGGLMHEFDFIIDDSTSPDHLFIEDFEHESGPV